MATIFHRTFGRAVSNSLRPRQNICRYNTPPARQIPSLPPSHILKLIQNRPWIQTRSLSSTPKPQNPRPYPHRQSDRPNKPPLLGLLDAIPENTVFWGIITLNGIVFVMWYMSSERLKQQRNPTSYKWMYDNFTDSWRNISSGRIWTLVTSCFSHEYVSHILFNGFTFFFMAKPVLSILGSRQFIFLYMGGGILANLASLAWSNLVKGRDQGSYGASAAVYAVVSFLACVAPKLTFQLYGIIPIPAWLAVTGIFAYDTYSAINDKRKTTDTAGHVAGLLSGIGYFFARRFRIF